MGEKGGFYRGHRLRVCLATRKKAGSGFRELFSKNLQHATPTVACVANDEVIL